MPLSRNERRLQYTAQLKTLLINYTFSMFSLCAVINLIKLRSWGSLHKRWRQNSPWDQLDHQEMTIYWILDPFGKINVEGSFGSAGNQVAACDFLDLKVAAGASASWWRWRRPTPGHLNNLACVFTEVKRAGTVYIPGWIIYVWRSGMEFQIHHT